MGSLTEPNRGQEPNRDLASAMAERITGAASDADVVLFVFREEYYLSNKEPRPGTDEYTKWQIEMAAVHGKAEIIIGKQRHGPTGTVNVQFEAAVTRFDNLARDDQMPERL